MKFVIMKKVVIFKQFTKLFELHCLTISMRIWFDVSILCYLRQLKWHWLSVSVFIWNTGSENSSEFLLQLYNLVCFILERNIIIDITTVISSKHFTSNYHSYFYKFVLFKCPEEIIGSRCQPTDVMLPSIW